MTEEITQQEYHARRLFALKKKGITQTYVAQQLGVTPECVNRVVSGVGENYYVKALITFQTGAEYEWLWGAEAEAPTPGQAEELRRKTHASATKSPSSKRKNNPYINKRYKNRPHPQLRLWSLHSSNPRYKTSPKL